MKRIVISVQDLLNRVLELSGDNIQYVELSIIDETIDQGIRNPGFIHFEGYSNTGAAKDYESIDSSETFYQIQKVI